MKHEILFVDDEQEVLDAFRAMMHSKRKEWKCSYANSGEAGLEMLEKSTFNVVIADMRMPGMDGATFLSEVAERQPGAIRMVLSGYSDTDSLMSATKVAHQFLTKPCSSDKLISTIQRLIDLDSILGDASIQAIVSKIDKLPGVPEVYMEVCRELETTEPDLARIGAIVEKDVGISATLLKVVNSSFFGFFEQVTSPTRAVALLGIETVKGLVLGAQLLQGMDFKELGGYSVDLLWQHSLQTGYIAKMIAGMEGKDANFMEQCFLAGMLHDVGKLVFVMEMDAMYQTVIDCAQDKGGPIVSCELETLGTGHAETGAYLLGLWGFDKAVVEGVFAHHSPQSLGKELTTALVVHVANALEHEMWTSSPGYTFSSVDEAWLEECGLADRYEAWREACSKEAENDRDG